MFESAVNFIPAFSDNGVEMYMDSTNYSRDTFSEQISSAVKAVGGNEMVGVMTPNEARATLGLPQLEDQRYNELYVPSKTLEAENAAD